MPAYLRKIRRNLPLTYSIQARVKRRSDRLIDAFEATFRSSFKFAITDRAELPAVTGWLERGVMRHSETVSRIRLHLEVQLANPPN